MPAIPKNVEENVPDFVIIGAMKAGTSSMHNLLDAHPDVFIPEPEIFFFDLDEFEAHKEFMFGPAGEWIERDFEQNFESYFEWYRSFFEEADDDAVLGEDSTTYAVSKLAPRRMARLLDEPKFIQMIRNPADRAYSQYWHQLRSGRATESFEQTLRKAPHDYLKYGYYEENLRRYLEVIDRSQLKIVFFERFVRETQTVVDEVCEFLDLPPSVDVEEAESHKNRARVPRYPELKWRLNHLDPNRGAFSYRNHLPSTDESSVRPGLIRQFQHTIYSVLDDVTMVGARRNYPPMADETREFLTTAFRRHNRNLSSIVGRDVSEWWDGW